MRISERDRYDSYCRFCCTIGSSPAPFEDWRKTVEKIGEVNYSSLTRGIVAMPNNAFS